MTFLEPMAVSAIPWRLLALTAAGIEESLKPEGWEIDSGNGFKLKRY
jgi:hypothetical protein